MVSELEADVVVSSLISKITPTDTLTDLQTDKQTDQGQEAMWEIIRSVSCTFDSDGEDLCQSKGDCSGVSGDCLQGKEDCLRSEIDCSHMRKHSSLEKYICSRAEVDCSEGGIDLMRSEVDCPKSPRDCFGPLGNETGSPCEVKEHSLVDLPLTRNNETQEEFKSCDEMSEV